MGELKPLAREERACAQIDELWEAEVTPPDFAFRIVPSLTHSWRRMGSMRNYRSHQG